MVDHLIVTRAQMSLENILHMESEEENGRVIIKVTLVELILYESRLIDQEVVEEAEKCEVLSVPPLTAQGCRKHYKL